MTVVKLDAVIAKNLKDWGMGTDLKPQIATSSASPFTGRRRPRGSKVADCDLRGQPRRAPHVPALGLYGAWSPVHPAFDGADRNTEAQERRVEATELDSAIAADLKELGYGG